jgi:transcriptional regulator with XRE-family HTH domain
MSHQDAGTVAARLRRAVLLSGMSRYELSRQADVSQSGLSRFVRGMGGLSVDNLERVAEALGLEVVVRERDGPPDSPVMKSPLRDGPPRRTARRLKRS